MRKTSGDNIYFTYLAMDMGQSFFDHVERNVHGRLTLTYFRLSSCWSCVRTPSSHPLARGTTAALLISLYHESYPRSKVGGGRRVNRSSAWT